MKILPKDHTVLRQIAVPVGTAEFHSPELKKLLKAMRVALAAEPDGVALAAPQVGVSKRIFIVSDKILATNPEQLQTKTVNLVFINPVITKVAKKKKWLEEGCLSARWLYGQVARAEKVSVEACDENGQKFLRHGTGLWAQIFQHEIDHLNGVLFIDKAKNLQEVKPEELENNA